MIFLSHNSKNKNLVEPMYLEMKKRLVGKKIFYDDESIQPGDSIIGKMSEGLGENNLFFLFWSVDAANSKMVEKEWQSALSKSINEGHRLVVVVLDRSPLPEILKDLKYLDFYSNGFTNTLDAMVNIANGESTFSPNHTTVNNLHFYGKEVVVGKEWHISAEALHSVEYGITYFVASLPPHISSLSINFKDSGINMSGTGSMDFNGHRYDVKHISTMQKFLAPGVKEEFIVKSSVLFLEPFLIGIQIGNETKIIASYNF